MLLRRSRLMVSTIFDRGQSIKCYRGFTTLLIGFHAQIDPCANAIIAGTAIYLFAIVPQFPAPANTTPTWMELDFTLDSQSFGRFISQPGSVNGAASNISSSGSSSATSPQYIPHVPVFQASGLEDKQHTLIVNVAPDTVFLFDYAIITQTKADAESNLGNAGIEA